MLHKCVNKMHLQFYFYSSVSLPVKNASCNSKVSPFYICIDFILFPLTKICVIISLICPRGNLWKTCPIGLVNKVAKRVVIK